MVDLKKSGWIKNLTAHKMQIKKSGDKKSDK